MQALADARRALAEREASLRDRDSRLAAMEARHREMSDQMHRRIAEEREDRDRELKRCREEAEAALATFEEDKEKLIAGGWLFAYECNKVYIAFNHVAVQFR